MISLANWIQQLIALPPNELNARYTKSDTARQEVESLDDIKPQHYRCAVIPAPLLVELHQKVRGQKCEAAIWDAIIFYLREPLLVPIAHDLIYRDIIVSQLGHVRQSDEIQWRLSSLVDEALLTFVWDMFTLPTYTAAELEELLSHHLNHIWLLDKWEHWALLSPQPREREKEIVFHRWAWNNANKSMKSSFSVPSPERYLEIMGAKEREIQRVQQENLDAQLSLETAERERLLQVQSLSKKALSQEEIERILSAKEPDELLALAKNPHVPVQCIEKLINCHHIKRARQIREVAQANLQARVM